MKGNFSLCVTQSCCLCCLGNNFPEIFTKIEGGMHYHNIDLKMFCFFAFEKSYSLQTSLLRPETLILYTVIP